MATNSHNTSPEAGKPALNRTVASAVAQDLSGLLYTLEQVQRIELTNAIAPLPLPAIDALDDRWMALGRAASPLKAPLPSRRGDATLLQARMLIHLAVQVNGAEEHASLCAAFNDLTDGAADRVPPDVYALLERARDAVETGPFPTVPAPDLDFPAMD